MTNQFPISNSTTGYGRLQLQPLLKKFSFSLILLLLSFVVGITGLFAVSDMVFEDRNLHFDRHIFALLQPYINEVNTGIFKVISFFGSVTFLVPASLILIFFVLFIKKDRDSTWKIAALSISNILVLVFLKNILKRQRPSAPLIENVNDYSFPSGHTLSSVVFYGLLCYLVYRSVESIVLKWWLIMLLVLFTCGIGVSRVYLRVHYASDVIGGFCLGMILLTLARWILVKTDDLPVKSE